MTDEVMDEGNVKLVRGEALAVLAAPQRSTAQQRVDDILDDVEAHLRASRDNLTYAIENMSILMVPQHRNVETLIGQLIEQVIEHKRLRQ